MAFSYHIFSAAHDGNWIDKVKANFDCSGRGRPPKLPNHLRLLQLEWIRK